MILIDLPCTSNTIPQLSSEPPTLDSETEMIFEKNRLAAEEKIEKVMSAERHPVLMFQCK